MLFYFENEIIVISENIPEKKFISAGEILERYKKGERNFSNIVCKGANLGGINLNGCDFSNSDLSFADFSRSDLIGCDFTKANLEWGDLTFANLSKSNFTKANISYSVLNNAIVDKAIFVEADLSWGIAFNVNLHAADLKGAKTATLATDVSQITESGQMHVREVLNRLKTSLPFSLWLTIVNSVDKNTETMKASREVTKTVSTYGIKRGITIPQPQTGGYTTTKSTYTETGKTLYGFETQYGRGSHKERKAEYMR